MVDNLAERSEVNKRKSRATGFEESIVLFLKHLEFSDVDGARDNFLVGGVQIDAVGGHEDTLFIVECRHKQSPGKVSLRDKIKSLRGCRESLERGFRAHQAYKRYSRFQYVLATKNVEVRKEDIDFANSESTRVYFWDDNFVNYYTSLFNKIGKYAKYNLLGEMGVRPSSQEGLSILASKNIWNKHVMYQFFIDPLLLLEVSYVARRERPAERFYQRIVDKERLSKIAKYVNDGNVLPNNIIIAFSPHLKNKVKFAELDRKTSFKDKLSSMFLQFGTLSFPRDYRSCWIIDGQHRLYSFINVEKPAYLPVVAFEDLDIEKQCKIFLDINKFQKPVPADLVWDLNGDMIASEPDGIISNVVKEINREGPLKHSIFIPSKGLRKKSGMLRMAGMCLALKRVKLSSPNTHSKTTNPFYSDSPQTLVKSLSRSLNEYFYVIQGIFEEDWKLGRKGYVLSDSGIGVLIRFFEKVVSRLKDKGRPDKQDFAKYLQALKCFLDEKYSSPEDKSKLRRSSSSEGGRDFILQEFIYFVRNKTGDKLFGGDLTDLGMPEIISLEKGFKNLIELELREENAGDEWLRDKIPASVYGKLEYRMQKNRLSPDEIHMNLNFGECREIFKIHQDRFKKYFVGTAPNMFDDIKSFDVALDLINKIRTKSSHALDLNEKHDDLLLFQVFTARLAKCVDSALQESSVASSADEEDDS